MKCDEKPFSEKAILRKWDFFLPQCLHEYIFFLITPKSPSHNMFGLVGDFSLQEEPTLISLRAKRSERQRASGASFH